MNPCDQIYLIALTEGLLCITRAETNLDLDFKDKNIANSIYSILRNATSFQNVIEELDKAHTKLTVLLDAIEVLSEEDEEYDYQEICAQKIEDMIYILRFEVDREVERCKQATINEQFENISKEKETILEELNHIATGKLCEVI